MIALSLKKDPKRRPQRAYDTRTHARAHTHTHTHTHNTHTHRTGIMRVTYLVEHITVDHTMLSFTFKTEEKESLVDIKVANS